MMNKVQRSRSEALTLKDLEGASEEGETKLHGDLTRHLRTLRDVSLTTVDVASVHAEMERNARNASTGPICTKEFKKFLEVSRETSRIKHKAPKNTTKRQKSLTIGVNSTNSLLGSMSMIDLGAPNMQKKKNPSLRMDNPFTWKTSFEIDAPRKPLNKTEKSFSPSRRTVDPHVGNESWDRFDPLSPSNRTIDSSAFSTSDVLSLETLIALRKLEQKASQEDRHSTKKTLGSLPKSKSRPTPKSGSKPSSKSNTTSKSRSPMRSSGAAKKLSGCSRSKETDSESRSSSNFNGAKKKLSGSSRSRRDSDASRSPMRSPDGASKKLSGSSRSRGRLTPKATSPKETIDKGVFEMFNWSSNSNLKTTDKQSRSRRSSDATERTASMPSLRDFAL